MDAAERLRRLEALAGEGDPLRRKLVALSLLADRLRSDGIVPIVVGGTALAIYTAGGYETKDVDLALPIAPEVDSAFGELGFTKSGRFWVRPELDLFFVAPAPAGLAGETAPRTEIEVDGLPVVVLGIEDLLLDRLRAVLYWKSDEDRRWSLRLARLWFDRIDWNYLAKVATSDEERETIASLREEATS